MPSKNSLAFSIFTYHHWFFVQKYMEINDAFPTNFALLMHRLREKANLESRKPPLCCKVATYCYEVAQCIAPRRLSSPSIKADY